MAADEAMDLLGEKGQGVDHPQQHDIRWPDRQVTAIGEVETAQRGRAAQQRGDHGQRAHVGGKKLGSQGRQEEKIGTQDFAEGNRPRNVPPL